MPALCPRGGPAQRSRAQAFRRQRDRADSGSREPRPLPAANPRVGARRVVRPIFIVGGWRTGSTLLQRLLAVEPRLRAARAWELVFPWEAAGVVDQAERERLIAKAQRGHDTMSSLNPMTRVIHEFSARLPEECILAMGSDFRTWFPTCQTRLPSYERWLQTQDFAPSYEIYRDVLRILQADDERTWVLKAPAHTPESWPASLEVFPDACVVQLHRDPLQTVASTCSLFATYRFTQSDEVDPLDVGLSVVDQLDLWLGRADRSKERVGGRFERSFRRGAVPGAGRRSGCDGGAGSRGCRTRTRHRRAAHSSRGSWPRTGSTSSVGTSTAPSSSDSSPRPYASGSRSTPAVTAWTEGPGRYSLGGKGPKKPTIFASLPSSASSP